MITHPMKYVAMSGRMAAEHPEMATEFGAAARRLQEAEEQTVQAYLAFKGLLRRATGQGSELAQRYLEETTWDLT